jgi:hypothetical protein
MEWFAFQLVQCYATLRMAGKLKKTQIDLVSEKVMDWGNLVFIGLAVFYKLKSAQFIIEKVPTLKKERLKLLFKRGPLYY